jgi:hypothetical protein
MPASRLCLLCVLIATTGLALAACSPTLPPAAAQPVAEVQAANAAAEAARPVEFSLGPNHFVLPANWFVDGIGPDFQGSVTLALHWPSLEPYPPGQPYGSFTTGPMRDQRVLITINYIDRVPIDELPERYVTQGPGEDAESPVYNLALRVRRPDRFDLEHYIVDLEQFEAWVNRFPGRSHVPASELVGRSSDWYIGRDTSDRIRTVVMCDDGRRPEGFEIRNEALVSIPGATRWPLCGGHRFSMPEFSLSINASYARPILRDWRRIESAVRDALSQAHDATSTAPTNGAPRP